MLLAWCLIYVASTYGVSSSHHLTFSVTLFAMTKTSGAMHVAKITNRRVDKSGQPREYVSHLLRRTYRDGAAVKHETLANLSPLPDAAIEAVRAALAGKTLVVAGVGLEVTGSLPHGHVAAVHAQAKALGLPALLGPAGRERDIALALIIARVCRPASKLATTGWWTGTTLAADLGVAGPFPVWWTHGLAARINREKKEWVRHAVASRRSIRQKRLPLSWMTIGQ